MKKVVPSTGETTIFVYDAVSKLVAEYSTIIAPPSEAKISYLTNDHLGSPRITTDQNGSAISRRDFLPYGEEIFSPQRTASLNYTADNIRQKFTAYERDNESNLDYAKARMYGYNHGRFTSPDPARMLGARMADPQHWNLYVYARNNPLLMVDITGEFPYTVYVRSFAPPGAFSGRGFRDDGRGFSTDTSSSTTSRVQQQITIDPTAQNWGNHHVTSSPTIWNTEYIQATETPYGRVTESAFQTQNGISTAAVSTEYSGMNALTKKISESATPAIDVQSTIAVSENSKTGQVLVSVNITGDRFPATEAIVADQKGNKVFIVGANAYGTPETGLPGNPKLPVASASLLINTDKKGSFTGVVYQGKTYSVDDWNKKALATPVQIRPRKEQDCNCLN